MKNCRAGEREPVGAGRFWLLGAVAGAGAAWKKSQEPEPLKIWPAPQSCEKIKCIRKYCTLVTLFR